MAKVLITGGSGLVGKYLHKKLIEKGYEVLILSRNKNRVNIIKISPIEKHVKFINPFFMISFDFFSFFAFS